MAFYILKKREGWDLCTGFLQVFLYQKDFSLVINPFSSFLSGFVFTRIGFMDNLFL